MNFHNVKGASIFASLYQCVLVLGVEFEVLMSYAEGASFTRFSLAGRRPMLTGESNQAHGQAKHQYHHGSDIGWSSPQSVGHT